jgi:hypothetical protein
VSAWVACPRRCWRGHDWPHAYNMLSKRPLSMPPCKTHETAALCRLSVRSYRSFRPARHANLAAAQQFFSFIGPGNLPRPFSWGIVDV